MNAQRLKPFPFICKKILKVFHLQKVHHAKIKFLLILLQMAILEIAPAEEEGRKSGFSFQHSLSTSFPSSHSGPLITNHKQHPDGRDFHSERMGGLGPSSSSSAYSVSSSTAIGHHRRRASLTDVSSTPSHSGSLMPFRHLTNVVDLTECRPKNTIFTAFKNIRQKIQGKIKQSNMSNIKFQSDLNGKQQTVKVDIKQGPFAKGVQAKLYHGMFNNPINGKMQMVSVKMVGPGTSALPEEKLKLLTPEQIIEEPKREIEIIQKLHENGAGKHVIKLYDGGEIQFNSDEKKSKNPFRYVLIQELGEQNFLEHFLEFSQTDAVYEKDVIKFLIQAAEVLVEIHKVAIHTDFKPQNLIYVKEGVEKTLAENIISDSNENNILNSKSGIQSSSSRGKNRNVEIQHHHHQSPATSQNESSPADNFENINENSEEGKAAEAGVKAPQYQRVLKAIDLGGCMLLPNHLAENPGSGERQERLDRMTSTFYIMAPEMDQIWLTKRHDHLKGLLEKANKNKTTEGIEEEFREVFEEEIKPSVTTKSDTWQFGMMIYALINPYQKFHDQDLWAATNMKRLKKINDLYKELNDMPEKSEQEWLRMNRFNTRAYRELFSEILDIRYYNPRLYLLAHNLLQKNNDIRLSAQGILDYLKNKCQLYGASGDPVTAWLDFATALNIFIGPLTLNVVEKMHQNTHSSMIELGSKKLRQIYKTKLNERKKGHDEEPQNCDRSYQPGEKDASKRSTFEKLEHLLAQIVP